MKLQCDKSQTRWEDRGSPKQPGLGRRRQLPKAAAGRAAGSTRRARERAPQISPDQIAQIT